MTTEVKTTPPEQTVADVALGAARTIISGIPLAGGPLKEFFSMIITPPLTKRRDDWVQSIAEGLVALQQKVQGFTIEALQNNEVFITAVLHAAQIAVRNHRKEKLDALRNAVLNVAINRAPDEDLQMLFFSWVDVFTVWHLRLLQFFQNPTAYAKEKGIHVPDSGILPLGAIVPEGDHKYRWEKVVTFIFQELKGRHDF